MGGRIVQSDELFSFVRLDERVPKDHPLRVIRALSDDHFSVDGTLIDDWASTIGPRRLGLDAWASMIGPR